MPRIRSVKPTIWTDDAFVEMSRDARLLTIGMITQADDDGRLVASASSLIGAIYPHDDVTAKQVEKWRGEVARSGVIDVYQVGRATYAVFPNWRKHQVINKRTASTLPAPPDDRPTTALTPVVTTREGQERPASNSRPEIGDRRQEIGEGTTSSLRSRSNFTPADESLCEVVPDVRATS